jgi:hypothetical protein
VGLTSHGRPRPGKRIWRRLSDGRPVFEQDDGLEMDPWEGADDRILEIENSIDALKEELTVGLILMKEFEFRNILPNFWNFVGVGACQSIDR